MKPFFVGRYDNPLDNETPSGFSSSFTKPEEVRRCFPERWLARNFELIETVAHTGMGLVDLWEGSPVRLDSNEPKTDQIIDFLFPGNPLFCCAWSRHRFDTRARENWYKLQDPRLIVPNPMTAKQGVTREGKLSAHAVSNTGPRRFLVVEFDFDASNSAEEACLLEGLASEGRDVKDLCAALLLHLAEKAPLALVVDSAGSLCTDGSIASLCQKKGCGALSNTLSHWALILPIGPPHSLHECRMDFARTADGRASTFSTPRWK